MTRSVSLLSGAIAATGLLAFGSAASADAIGSAVSVVPSTMHVRAGTTRTLAINDLLEQDDRVRTAPAGSARVRFRDDTLLTVGPNADLLLDRFVFDGSQARSVGIDLARGALRFVSGVSDRKAYEIKTPVVTLGVRGTIVDILVARSRVVINAVDGMVIVCHPRAGCREIKAGDPALAATLAGFTPAGAQEAARLWRLLDGAHFALDRRIGQDPSGFQQAQFLTPASQPGGLPATGPFTSPLLGSGTPTFAAGDVVQSPFTVPQPPADPPPPPPPPPLDKNRLAGFAGGSGSLLSAPLAGRAAVAFRSGGTVDRIELGNGQVRQRGTAVAAEAESFSVFGLADSFSVIGVERWTSGTYGNGAGASVTLNANQGLHVLYGQRATEVPLDTRIDYQLAHATKPTVADGSYAPGSFWGALSIEFGPAIAGSKVGADFAVDMNGKTYTFGTNGGTEDISSSSTRLLADGRFSASSLPVYFEGTSAICPGSSAGCKASFQGFIAGRWASYAGVLYHFGQSSVPGKNVSGAAVFDVNYR